MVISKFRKLYIGKYVFLFSIVLILLIASCFFSLNDRTAFLPICLILLAIIVPTSMEVLTISKVIISEDGIVNIALVSKKKTIIKYADIVNFGSKEVITQTRRGPISEGYMKTIINLKSGDVLIISQDYYENYPELNTALLKYYHKD